MFTSQRSNTSSQITAISRLFSSGVVQELSKKGQSPLFKRLLDETGLVDGFDLSEPIGNIFDKAFKLLRQKDNRHEYIYKSALAHKILLGTHSLKTAAMINEFRVGDCKADVVILNGTAIVYEIKSERDSLKRLLKQVTTYRDVFAKVNVIAGKNHIEAVLSIVPDYVGVLQLSDRFRISSIRESQDAPERTRPEAIFQSIQMREAKEILNFMGIEIPKVPNTTMHSELLNIFKNLDSATTHRAMVTVLKKTRSLVSLSDFVGELPDSLLAAVFSTRIRKSDHFRLLRAIKTPIIETNQWN